MAYDSVRGIDFDFSFSGTPTSNVFFFLNNGGGFGIGATWPRYQVPVGRTTNRARLYVYCTLLNTSGGIGPPQCFIDLYRNGSGLIQPMISLSNGATGQFTSAESSVTFVGGQDDFAVALRGPGASFSMPVTLSGRLTLDLA